MTKSLWAAALLFIASQAIAGPLPTTTVVIDTGHGPHAFQVEVAADEASRARGLMFRKSLGPDAGMLFDFHNAQMVGFWMRNTLIPLDMIFIRQNGTISSVAEKAVPMSEVTIPSAEPIRAVLEINGGRAQALGIEPDETVHNTIFGNALPSQLHPGLAEH